MILIVMMLVILCTACGTEDSDFRFSHVVDVPKERLEDFDEVLWYDHVSIMDSDYCVFYLDEWRNSEWYPKLDK